MSEHNIFTIHTGTMAMHNHKSSAQQNLADGNLILIILTQRAPVVCQNYHDDRPNCSRTLHDDVASDGIWRLFHCVSTPEMLQRLSSVTVETCRRRRRRPTAGIRLKFYGTSICMQILIVLMANGNGMGLGEWIYMGCLVDAGTE